MQYKANNNPIKNYEKIKNPGMFIKLFNRQGNEEKKFKILVKSLHLRLKWCKLILYDKNILLAGFQCFVYIRQTFFYYSIVVRVISERSEKE